MLTYFLSAVAEQILVHRLVAILVVELGGHDVAVAGDGQELCLNVTSCPPEALLGPHPGLQPHIFASSWVTSEGLVTIPDSGSLSLSVTRCLAPSCVSEFPDYKLVTGDNSATRTFVIKMTTSNGGPTNRKLAKYPPKLIC